MSKRIVDHEGNEFPSIEAMCKYWGIKKHSYEKRIKRGWSLEDTLTIPVGSKGVKKTTDHEGNEFSSIIAMCRYWGITRDVYEGRIKMGWSLEDTLTIPVGSKSLRRITIIDHKGNEFPSITAMCKHWNIPPDIYRGRIKLGWSKKDALLIPIGSINPSSKKVADHEGNEFSSINAMCNHWGITKAAYGHRIKSGWSLKDTLTIPVGLNNSKRIVDHEGNEFPSITAMCKHWNITKATYNNRIELGWSLQKTLTTISKNTNICDGYTVLYQIDYCEDEGSEVNCYMCSIKGIDGPIIRDFEDIFNDLLQFRETGHIDWIDLIQKGNK